MSLYCFNLKGEYCSACGEGSYCPYDNMSVPLSVAGWFIMYDKTPSSRCSKETALRSACPVALPCYPSEACLGSNICDSRYKGERCSTCTSTSVRINGTCEDFSVLILAIILFLLVLLVNAVFYAIKEMGRDLPRNQNILCYNFELLDILQTVGAFSKLNIAAGSLFGDNVRMATSIFFVPFEFMISSADFQLQFILFQLIPVFVVAALAIMFTSEVTLIVRKATKSARVFCADSEATSGFNSLGRSNFFKEIQRVMTSLRGKYYCYYLTAMIIVFVPVLNHGLSIFDCNPTEPNDGSYYLLNIGASSKGECYRNGTIQQSLASFATVTLVLYGVLIPFSCIYAVYYYQSDLRLLEDSSYKSYFPWNHCATYYGCLVWMTDAIFKKLLLCIVAFTCRSNPEFMLAIIAALELFRLILFICARPFTARDATTTLLSKLLDFQIVNNKTLKGHTTVTDFTTIRCALSTAVILLSLGTNFAESNFNIIFDCYLLQALYLYTRALASVSMH